MIIIYPVKPGPPNIPHISSELNLPAIFHQEPGSPSEVHVHHDTDQSPTEAAAAVDGVDQSDLNFMSESGIYYIKLWYYYSIP